MFIKIIFQKQIWLWRALLITSVALVLSACAGSKPTPVPPTSVPPTAAPTIPEVSIDVSESGITVPDVVPGGIVGISIHNTGASAHSVDLWRIKKDHTRDEIVAMNDYLMENPDDFFGVFELGSWIHYLENIDPGATNHFYADLGTGDFFVSDETNPDLGPIFFSATELVGATEPAADVKVDMVDFAYVMPDVIPAGKQLWEVTNSGEQWHLAAITTTNLDASPEEILASFGGENEPLPADAAVDVLGGMPPMSPGERVWIEIDLEPGTYELVCPLPDVTAFTTGEEPLSHLLHGMRRSFTVEN